jgi:hypothetical protein
MKKIFLLFCVIAVQSSPTERVLDYPVDDVGYTKEQEEAMKNPTLGWNGPWFKWSRNLQGKVVIPYEIDSDAGYSE